MKQIKEKIMKSINSMLKSFKFDLSARVSHEVIVMEKRKEYDPTSVDSLFM